MKPKISCILTTLNPNLSRLEKAIASAKPVFDEIVLIDDGSDVPVPDATVRLNKNCGIATALNDGIAVCTGDWYSAFADDDEYITAEAFRLADWIRETNPSPSIIDFNVELVEGTGPTRLWKESPQYSLLSQNPQVAGQSFVHKSVWEKLGGYRSGVYEDWDFMARAYFSRVPITKVDKTIVRYCIRSGTATGHDDSFEHREERYNVTRKAIADWCRERGYEIR